MNPVLPARRRAEQFSSLVEGSPTTPLDGTAPAALLPLVDLVTTLRSTPAPEARPEFVAALRERLLLEAETALVPGAPARAEARRQPTPRRTGHERRVAAGIGALALVSATASMSVAAQHALPGDTLYPLKRALENLHETVLRSDDVRGATMLDNASGRLDEVDELARSGSQDPDAIASTLRAFSDQAVEASDVLLDDYEQTGRLSSVAEVRTFTATSLDVIEQLQGLVPPQVRPVLAGAAGVLDDIDRLARTICPDCSALPAVSELTSAADLGPLSRLLDEVVRTPTQQPGPTKGDTPSTEQPSIPTADPTPSATPSTPAAPQPSPPAPDPGNPTTAAPDIPDTPDTPDKPPTTPPSLGAVVGGLPTVDLGGVLTGVTDELTEDLDEGLGGLLGGSKSE